MKGFVLGLLVAALVFAGYLVWKQRQTGPAEVVVLRPDAGPAAVVKKRKRRARGAAREARVVASAGPAAAPAHAPVAAPPPPEPEPEPVKLSAADLRTVSQGDDLSRPDVLKLDMGSSGGASDRDLTQDDIDARFRPAEDAILECISNARPDPETYVPGRVTVKFRIQRTGHVRGVRVEAPAILQKGGVYGCIKGVVGRLSFPASNGSQVVSYPYSLS